MSNVFIDAIVKERNKDLTYGGKNYRSVPQRISMVIKCCV